MGEESTVGDHKSLEINLRRPVNGMTAGYRSRQLEKLPYTSPDEVVRRGDK